MSIPVFPPKGGNLTVSQHISKVGIGLTHFLLLSLRLSPHGGPGKPLLPVCVSLDRSWCKDRTAILLISLAFISIYSPLIFPFIKYGLLLSSGLMPAFLL